MSAWGESSPSVLFLHGAGAGGWEWRIWREIFAADGYACRCPDLKPSADRLSETGFADYLEIAAAELQDWTRPGVVIGASLGALLALSLNQRAGVAADRISHLVLINPHPGWPESEQMPALRAAVDGRVDWGRRSRLVNTRRSLADADEASCLLAFRHWRDESQRVLVEARSQRIEAPLRIPALWLACDDDHDVPPALGHSMADRLGGQRLLLSGDHLSPLIGKQAPAVARQVLAWLSIG